MPSSPNQSVRFTHQGKIPKIKGNEIIVSDNRLSVKSKMGKRSRKRCEPNLNMFPQFVQHLIVVVFLLCAMCRSTVLHTPPITTLITATLTMTKKYYLQSFAIILIALLFICFIVHIPWNMRWYFTHRSAKSERLSQLRQIYAFWCWFEIRFCIGLFRFSCVSILFLRLRRNHHHFDLYTFIVLFSLALVCLCVCVICSYPFFDAVFSIHCVTYSTFGRCSMRQRRRTKRAGYLQHWCRKKLIIFSRKALTQCTVFISLFFLSCCVCVFICVAHL